ncbi:hypothetical protein C2E20_8994 [Micractinium conductrix]|uniref:MYND-type domain-containing protein n=2 Tax=Micractinium conductrix TaxID=554055 RepID=A0A2P6UZR1_9CHLO|nr:hypothetical protein C2E20_8994 [Micractinium conductrix]|eukprot:PSC67321.1 hypothetical protein C2E20_8994 [Micractinium conductrix]
MKALIETMKDCISHCQVSPGRWDYHRLAGVVAAQQLAEALAAADPALPATEDKLQVLNNLLVPFGTWLSPALGYGGLAGALVRLFKGTRRDWEAHGLSLSCLRLIVAAALTDHLRKVAEKGMAPQHAQSVDDCLETLADLLRYLGHPAVEAAKKAAWRAELPAALLMLAQDPVEAWGVVNHEPYLEEEEEDEEGEEEAEEGGDALRYFLPCSLNIVRLLGALTQRTGHPTRTMMKQGDLLMHTGAYEVLLCLLETACHMTFTDKYAQVSLEPQESGAAMLRNLLALVGYGTMFVSQEAIEEWREAGPTSSACPHFCSSTCQSSARATIGRQGMIRKLAGALQVATLELSIPGNMARQDEPRAQHGVGPMEARPRIAQVTGPGGMPLDIYEVSMTLRDYHRKCAKCGRNEEQLAAAQQAQQPGPSTSAQAPTHKHLLRTCTACRRVWYCGVECQRAHWSTHKPVCKRYQRHDDEEEEEEEEAEGEEEEVGEGAAAAEEGSSSQRCAGCGRRAEEGPPLRECSACHRAAYCGAECQRQHWRQHKPLCKQHQREQQAAQ